MNMGKTKVMVGGLDLDLLKRYGKVPCGFCQKGVPVGSNAIIMWWLLALDTQEMQ